LATASAYQANFPLHVAIIMDGNGRWAQARHRPRVFGHQAGVKTVRRIVEDAADMGIQHLTLYSFSTENWTRPKAEIAALFNLLRKYVDLLELIDRVEATTKTNNEFHLNIAFNYGGRDEILRAAAKAAADGKNLETMTEAELTPYLDTADLPEPDLVIRTSGEKRISNFLLWQAAYSEFVFTDVLWPDFTKADLQAAISDFQNRERRFGNLTASEVA